MAWIHGNELSWQYILKQILQNLDVISWKVIIIPEGNPRAIKENIRFSEKNMNRAFHSISQWDLYEDRRVQEIIPVLKQSDILLDIHNTLSIENSVPFLISEHKNWNQYFPVKITVSGLDILHPGWSDGYMNSIWKVGLCIESGSIHFDDKGEVARESIMNFLRATGNIMWTPLPQISQKHFHLDTIYHAQTADVRFIKKWWDFERVVEWEIIWHDGKNPIIAPYNGIIVFTYLPKQIGDEMCVFGKEIVS